MSSTENFEQEVVRTKHLAIEKYRSLSECRIFGTNQDNNRV